MNGVPHRKRTRVVTNCREIAEGLSVFRCRRDHPHSPVIGGSKVTARAGHYPRGMVKVIVENLEKAARRRGAWSVLANENEDEDWEDPAAAEQSGSEAD